MDRFRDYTQERSNFWSKDDRHFRLFAHSVTPNGCWLAAAQMREIQDIDISTGEIIYGEKIELENGTVPGCFPFLKR